MNYIELINRFWQEVEMKDFLPSEACVYFRLLDICNKLGWQNPFSLSNSRAVALMAMNEKTFRAIRDKLGGRGLIEFKKGKKRESAPMYCFPEKTDDGWFFPWGNFLEVKNTVKNTVNTPANATVNTTANTPVNTPAYSKTKTKTNKSPNGDNAGAPQQELSLFAEEDKRAARRKPKTAKDPPLVPTIEEVLEYFLSQDADKRLENWEESARRFYDNFNAVEWRDKFNRRITRWDSRANSWILDDEKRQKERRQNEQPRTDGPVSPSGGISIRGKVTPSCGLKRRNPGGET
mgnify:CR=1 FL=1|jgi:hypothetical protein